MPHCFYPLNPTEDSHSNRAVSEHTPTSQRLTPTWQTPTPQRLILRGDKHQGVGNMRTAQATLLAAVTMRTITVETPTKLIPRENEITARNIPSGVADGVYTTVEARGKPGIEIAVRETDSHHIVGDKSDRRRVVNVDTVVGKPRQDSVLGFRILIEKEGVDKLSTACDWIRSNFVRPQNLWEAKKSSKAPWHDTYLGGSLN